MKTQRYWLLALASFLLTSVCVPGADSSLRGPLAGYAGRVSPPELRAISGVPGGYLFSDPLPLPDGTARIHAAAGQDFALLDRGDAGLAMLYLSGGAIDHVAAVAGAMASPDWVAFSPAGGSAVMYSATAGRVQVLSGLPDNPQVAMDVDASTLPELPLLGAVSDDGSLVLLASGNAVYALPQTGPAKLLVAAGGILSLAVFPNGTDAVVANRSTGSVQVIRNAASTPAVQTLVSGLAGMGKVRPSADGATVFVTRPGLKAVSQVDAGTGEVQTVDAGAVPADLVALRNRDTFLIASKAGEPGAVFLRDGSSSKVVLIPAVKPAESLQ